MLAKSGSMARLFAGMLAGGLFALPGLAHAEKAEHAPPGKPGSGASAATAPSPSRARKASPYRPVKATYKARNYYVAAWGIDKLKVSRTASGNLIRFSFRITEPARAAALIDRKLTPYMLGQKSRALLSIPIMEKIGPLRQSGAAKAGQEYWMTFSNKGDLIKPGDRVNVMIGQFHADGLMVE